MMADREGADPIDVEVGINLRRVRKEKSLSQDELGKALGITFQQVQKYENGKNRMSASMLVKAARKLDIQPADLLPASDAAPLPPSAQLLSLRGAEEMLQLYGAIRSPVRRRAIVMLARALVTDKGDQA